MEIIVYEDRLMVTFAPPLSERARVAQVKHEQQEKLLASFRRGGSITIPLRMDEHGKPFAAHKDIREALGYDEDDEDG